MKPTPQQWTTVIDLARQNVIPQGHDMDDEHDRQIEAIKAVEQAALSSRPSIYRGWINQPSTLQPLHSQHGMRGIIEDTDPTRPTVRIWFATGDIVSMEVPRRAVSKSA